MANEKGEDMLEIIDDLLDFASSGNSNQIFTPFLTNSILEALLKKIEILLHKNEAKLDLPNIEFTITGNLNELVRVFQNLVENAIKYNSPHLNPEIKISIETQLDTIVFSVADNGLGVPSKHKESIFNPFVRVHKDFTSAKGSGIGLATCKKIIEAHKGNIWVESEINKGSTFYVSIPRQLTQ